MYPKRSAVQLCRLLTGPMCRPMYRPMYGPMCGPTPNQSLLDREHLMCLLIRRGFKSPNTLHHRKANNIPFYTHVGRVIKYLFPLMLFLAIYKVDAPDSFLGNVFGFRQFKEHVEDEKDESVRKRKKIKRFLHDGTVPST